MPEIDVFLETKYRMAKSKERKITIDITIHSEHNDILVALSFYQPHRHTVPFKMSHLILKSQLFE